MNATAPQNPTEAASNVIALTIPQRAAKPVSAGHRSRFKIQPFVNPRTGTTSWRVTGIKRDGSRVRENFAEQPAAECRHVELTTEWLAQKTETSIRATKLTDNQVRLAETAFLRLGADDDLMLAVEHWLTHGKQLAVVESPRLDEAAELFIAWVKHTDSLRPRTKDKLRIRINLFRNSLPNNRIADITPDVIDGFLAARKVASLTKKGDLEAISRFFSWCIERPRKWAVLNPCRQVKVERSSDGAAAHILTVEECGLILKAAQNQRNGRLLPYIAVCMFAGLRPAEAQRLTWAKVNLADGEILVEKQSSKTKKSRVVRIEEPLRQWLALAKDQPFFPANFRKDFDAIKQAAGYTGREGESETDLKPWPADVLRHTAISHYFRKTGSYGQAAEQFGNSEHIIKKHYQGRVSSEETKRFYALRPAKKGSAK